MTAKGDTQVAVAPRRLLDGVRVLVIDDQPDAVFMVSRVLELNGATVTIGSSVPEALACVSSASPEVLISDISMPDQDGYDLIRALRDEEGTSRIPAPALSAHTTPDDHERSIKEGFHAHFTKPSFQIHLAKPVRLSGLIQAVSQFSGHEARL